MAGRYHNEKEAMGKIEAGLNSQIFVFLWQRNELTCHRSLRSLQVGWGQNGSHTRNGDLIQNIDRDVSRMVPKDINHCPLTTLFFSSLDIITRF